MAKPPEVMVKQIEKMQEQIEKFRAKLNDPTDPPTPEEEAEWEQAIDDFQAKIDKITGGGPTVTPTS